jgi:GMP synthase (glutamine-hydrolysing)
VATLNAFFGEESPLPRGLQDEADFARVAQWLEGTLDEWWVRQR